MPLDDALRLSSQRIRLPDFQFFAVAVLLQQSAGGNLLPTLETLAQMMRNRRAMALISLRMAVLSFVRRIIGWSVQSKLGP